MEFCYAQLVAAGGREGHAQDQLHHHCMAFLHGAITCPSYKGSASSAGGGSRDEQQVRAAPGRWCCLPSPATRAPLAQPCLSTQRRQVL
jgi:hypothetical protein